MLHSHIVDGGEGFQMWRVAANVLNKLSWTANKWWSPSWGWAVALCHQNKHLTKYDVAPQTCNALTWTLDWELGMWGISTGHVLDSNMKKITKIKIRFSESIGGQMGRQWHWTSRQLYSREWKWECRSSHRDKFFCKQGKPCQRLRVEFVSERLSHFI